MWDEATTVGSPPDFVGQMFICYKPRGLPGLSSSDSRVGNPCCFGEDLCSIFQYLRCTQENTYISIEPYCLASLQLN